MTTLRELQRRFKAHLLDGDTAIAQSVAQFSAADGDERLGVYAFGYGQRLRDALRIEFPGLAALAGAKPFNELLDHYIRACPSRHANVRWLGRDMADWLTRDAHYAKRTELAEMARLDWALSTAFDSPDIAAINSDALTTVAAEHWPTLRFTIHPVVQTMPLGWNVDEIRLAIGDKDSPAPALERVECVELVVWRKDYSVRYRRLDTDEATTLTAVKAQAKFADICELLCEWHSEDAVAIRAVFLLQRWFAAGWIVALDANGNVDGPPAVA